MQRSGDREGLCELENPKLCFLELLQSLYMDNSLANSSTQPCLGPVVSLDCGGVGSGMSPLLVLAATLEMCWQRQRLSPDWHLYAYP